LSVCQVPGARNRPIGPFAPLGPYAPIKPIPWVAFRSLPFPSVPFRSVRFHSHWFASVRLGIAARRYQQANVKQAIDLRQTILPFVGIIERKPVRNVNGGVNSRQIQRPLRRNCGIVGH